MRCVCVCVCAEAEAELLLLIFVGIICFATVSHTLANEQKKTSNVVYCVGDARMPSHRCAQMKVFNGICVCVFVC